jgi:hypothetical protein
MPKYTWDYPLGPGTSKVAEFFLVLMYLKIKSEKDLVEMFDNFTRSGKL